MRAADCIGEDPGPDALPGREVPGELGGDRGGPLEHGRCVVLSEQRHHRHRDQELVRRGRLLHRGGVQHGVGEDRVAQGAQRERCAALGEVAVEVEGERPLGPVREGGALGSLHVAGGDVEPVGEPLDLEDRAGDQQRGGAGGGVDVDDLHIAALRGRGRQGAGGRELDGESEVPGEGVERDGRQLDRRHVGVDLGGLLVGQSPHPTQEHLMHRLGEIAAAQVLEGERHDLDRPVRIEHLAPGLVVGAAKSGRDLQRRHVRVLGTALHLRVLTEEGLQQPQVMGVQPGTGQRGAVQRHHPPGLDSPLADLLEDALRGQRPTGAGAPCGQLRDRHGREEGAGARRRGRRRDRGGADGGRGGSPLC